MIKRGSELLAAIERALTVIAVVFLFAIMVLVVADVFMRYAVNRPFSFTYDLIGLYLLAGVFFLTLSDALREHAHVGVDILLHRFSPAGRRLSEIVTALVGLFVFVLISKVGFDRALDNFQQSDVLAGAIAVADLDIRGAGAARLRRAGAAACAATGRQRLQPRFAGATSTRCRRLPGSAKPRHSNSGGSDDFHSGSRFAVRPAGDRHASRLRHGVLPARSA